MIIGSGIGGLKVISDGAVTLHERGPRRVTPFFIPASLINLASGQVSIRHGFKGPNHSVVTACSSGAHAIGDAARMHPGRHPARERVDGRLGSPGSRSLGPVRHSIHLAASAFLCHCLEASGRL